MSTYPCSAKTAMNNNILYQNLIDSLPMACNVHDSANISRNSAKLTSIRQVLKGEMNCTNDYDIDD